MQVSYYSAAEMNLERLEEIKAFSQLWGFLRTIPTISVPGGGLWDEKTREEQFWQHKNLLRLNTDAKNAIKTEQGKSFLINQHIGESFGQSILTGLACKAKLYLGSNPPLFLNEETLSRSKSSDKRDDASVLLIKDFKVGIVNGIAFGRFSTLSKNWIWLAGKPHLLRGTLRPFTFAAEAHTLRNISMDDVYIYRNGEPSYTVEKFERSRTTVFQCQQTINLEPKTYFKPFTKFIRFYHPRPMNQTEPSFYTEHNHAIDNKSMATINAAIESGLCKPISMEKL